ncbi:efflux RND transporter permease subunit [Desulfitobacterium chlororespirans]|uniref:Heavy metal efflux pump, CzcA family/hydrophobe/amphiphile efflux-1 (HAE1) family protein n=1 Tax=Desulfitobacterium chlororespirans DSM 11544 TaxID=1121395 RepID=A0A1M7UR42_9FIRM|nr:efflux RND transporter permease subunit [Desulfitobacterium chlororespirans]SHN85357.1 heavy metal efflux pump, CzcA family/hydrophobe/amphiphile efflux-1 (HAE1) family protein [Desulfitobacterium chlororespirans DSM 11544]
MFLTDISLKRPVFATVIVIALLALGALSYIGLPINENPEVDVPMITVTISLPGTAAEQLESQVTKKVEEAVGQISGVKHISSTITESFSQTMIQFSSGTPVNVAAQEIKDKISSIRGTLPQDINEPIVQKFDLDAVPIISFVVTSPLSNKDLSQVVEDEITKKLNTVKGVGSVTTYGAQVREIHIKLDKEKMAALNVTTAEITQSLQSDNIDISSGKVSNGDKEVSLRTNGTVKEVNDFLNILVTNRQGTELRIKDIAQVEDTVKEPDSLSYYKGEESIGINIVKQSGENTTQVADDLKVKLAEIQASLPKDVKIDIVDDNSLVIRASVSEVQKTLLEGCILAVLVVFVFLRNGASTAISAISLPTSIITTFAAMKLMNFSLNSVSLMGLSLAVGLLIDDAIVVVENIVRHINMGKSPMQAAKDGASEIGLAVTATTFTIVAVFLPITMVEGSIGVYFAEFGLTVAVSVLISLFVSFTLVPLMASKYLKSENDELDKKYSPLGKFLIWFNHLFVKLAGVYTTLLSAALKHRIKTIAIATAMFFGSLLLLNFINPSFLESSDNGKITITAATDGGTTLTSAAETTKQMESILNKYPEVVHLYSTVTLSNINISVQLIDKNARKETLSETAHKMRESLKQIPGITLSIETGSTLGGGAKDADYHFTGDDFEQLLNYSQQAESAIKRIPGAVDVSMSYKSGKAEATLEVDRDRAADLGVSPLVVANTLGTLFNGSLVTQYETEKDRYDVKLLLQDDQKKDFDSLKGIYVPGSNNSMVPLDQVTKQVFATGSTTINRYDKAREIQVTANVFGVATGDFNTQIKAALENETKMPAGVSQVSGGDQEEVEAAIPGLMKALFLGILFIYLILAALFESFIDPLAIVFALPFGIIGALLALFLSGSSLSMMTFIGIIMLMGLVTKNAILLVDYAKQKLGEGEELSAALLLAASTRLRPIIMTTLAMIFGMLPTALSTGLGSEGRSPMAYAIIGGLITSTFLTLIVVPVIYTLLDDAKAFFARNSLRL